MTGDLIAKAETSINATVNQVWDALVNPEKIKKYMFGTTVNCDWTEGSAITWKGEWKGKPYEDKGEILKIVPNEKLQYSHFSPLTGQEDISENYHTVTIDLFGNETETHVTFSQNKNATEEEQKHSQENWSMMLAGLKKVTEESE